ncbi:MAG TPA: hypothetical protein VGH43_11925 [Jatrophihabitans sp.]
MPRNDELHRSVDAALRRSRIVIADGNALVASAAERIRVTREAVRRREAGDTREVKSTGWT